MPKIYGQLEEAQLEVLEAAPTNQPVARTYFDKTENKTKVKHNTTLENLATETYVDFAVDVVADALQAHESDTSTHGVGEIVGRTEAQTLTNKTLTSPVITNPTGLNKSDVGLSNVDNTSDATKNAAPATLTNKTLASPIIQTPEVDVLTLAQQTTPTTPAAGKNKVYVKADNKAYILDSTGGEKQLGSGGTGINFIEDGDASAGVTNYVKYADTGSRPVDGTGGTPTITFTTTTTAPLSGSESFLLSKPASNCQGQGVSRIFNIDNANKAKVLQIEFDYIVESGTFIAGSQSADSDVICYIYDVTNNQLIEPSTFKLYSISNTLGTRFIGNFQTSANSTQYRLIFHVATASTFAYSLKIDNITVAPSKYVYGTPITDWSPYAAGSSVSSGTVTNATYIGFYRRVGGDVEVQWRADFSGPGGTWTNFRPALVPGLNLDANRLVQELSFPIRKLGPSNAWVGSFIITTLVGTLTRWDSPNTGSNKIDFTNSIDSSNSSVVNGDRFVSRFSYPVQGWASSVQMSDSADVRSVSFYAYKTGGNQNGSSGVNTFTGVLKDTHGGFSLASGQYIIPVAGDYQFTLNYEWTTAQAVGIGIAKNGAIWGNYSSSASATYGGTTVLIADCKAGDIISFRSSTTSVLNLTSFTAMGFRVAGPTSIGATETVAVRAATGAGQSISNGTTPTTVLYGSKTLDTHGVYNTSTGVFTAPVSGVYYAKATVSPSGNFGKYVSIIVNNLTYSLTYGLSSVTTTITVSDLVYLKAGDSLKINCYVDSGSTNLDTAPTLNTLSIYRVGL